jgi:hypothetical protein
MANPHAVVFAADDIVGPMRCVMGAFGDIDSGVITAAQSAFRIAAEIIAKHVIIAGVRIVQTYGGPWIFGPYRRCQENDIARAQSLVFRIASKKVAEKVDAVMRVGQATAPAASVPMRINDKPLYWLP